MARHPDATGEPIIFQEPRLTGKPLMPEDLPEITPLDLSDNEDSDPILYPPDTRSPEEIALRKDLSVYDNGDIYFNPSQPQLFKLGYTSFLLPDNPRLFNADLNGDLLPEHLVNLAWNYISRDPNFAERLKEHNCKDLAEYRRAFETEESDIAARFKTDQWKFFLRSFPKLLVALFTMTAFSSFMAMGLSLWRERPDAQLNEFEKTVRTTLENQFIAFEKLVKELVGMRASGRPKNIYAEGDLPEIVRTVLRTAFDLMGNERGKDAVPGLKAIAIKLDTNEGALGRRLRLAGHSWTRLRTWLENVPPDPT